MAALIIAYDLNKQGQNYECIVEKLRDLQAWDMQQSVWILETDSSAADIRNHLAPCLDTNDSLFVGKLSAAAWKGLSDDAGAWLKKIIA